MKKITWTIIIIMIALLAWYTYSSQTTPAIPASSDVGTQLPADTSSSLSSLNANSNASSTQSGSTQTTSTFVLNAVTDPTLGNYLTDTNGMTLYEYSQDSAGISNCSGTCITNWPPYLAPVDKPLIGENKVPGAIAAITRTDGTMQVTYNGMPLYYYKNDTKPGDTTGQNIGGVWSVAQP